MKATTFNLVLSAVLVSLAVVNWVHASRDRSAYASVPQCGGVAAPSPDCACCEESQTWICP